MPVMAITLAAPDARDEKNALMVWLSIFAGGNALILGSAIGDFGRTVQALLISITVVSAFSFLPIEYGLLAPFAIVPAITASLSMDRSFLGFTGAAYLGVKAVLRGFGVWILAYIVAAIALALFLYVFGLLRRAEALATHLAIVIVMGFLTAIANADMIGYLFNSAHRVRADSPQSSSGSVHGGPSASSESE
jgi:hypothetical protein